MKVLDNGSFEIEVGDKLEIKYSVGNKTLGVHEVKTIFNSMFEGQPEVGRPLYFPYPNGTNIEASWATGEQFGNDHKYMAYALIYELPERVKESYVYMTEISKEMFDKINS